MPVSPWPDESLRLPTLPRGSVGHLVLFAAPPPLWFLALEPTYQN